MSACSRACLRGMERNVWGITVLLRYRTLHTKNGWIAWFRKGGGWDGRKLRQLSHISSTGENEASGNTEVHYDHSEAPIFGQVF